MSKNVRSVIIGLVVTFGLSFLMSLSGTAGVFAYAGAVFFGVFTWFILANLANNRKLVRFSPQEQQALLHAPPPQGHGLLYVYREGFVGMALGIDVQIDGREAAQLKSGYFVRLVLPVGEHLLTAGPKGIATAQNKVANLRFWCMEGAALVMRLGLGMGMLQNAMTITPEPDFQAAWTKLGGLKMVTAQDVSLDSAQPVAGAQQPRLE